MTESADAKFRQLKPRPPKGLPPLTASLLYGEDALAERHRAVLDLRYGVRDGRPRTFAEIATDFNVSVDTVKRIHREGLRRLREPERFRPTPEEQRELNELLGPLHASIGDLEEPVSAPCRVFLCHSSHDKPFVDRLAGDLKASGLGVWYDKWEMKVGDSLRDKIQEGIASSSFLAIVLSPKSVESRWVNVELNSGLALEMERRAVFVLPLLIANCDLPVFLQDKLYADFRTSYEAGLAALLNRVGAS